MRRRFRHADPNPFAGAIYATKITAVIVSVVVLAMWLLGGCATNAPVIEVKMSYDTRKTTGRQPTTTLRVRQYFGREPGLDRLRWFGEYEHKSSFPDGKPWNGRNDTHTIDSFGIGIATPLWKAK